MKREREETKHVETNSFDTVDDNTNVCYICLSPDGDLRQIVHVSDVEFFDDPNVQTMGKHYLHPDCWKEIQQHSTSTRPVSRGFHNYRRRQRDQAISIENRESKQTVHSLGTLPKCGICRQKMLGLNADYTALGGAPSYAAIANPLTLQVLESKHSTFQIRLESLLTKNKALGGLMIEKFPEQTVHLNKPLIQAYLESDVAFQSSEMERLFRIAFYDDKHIAAWKKYQKNKKLHASVSSGALDQLSRRKTAAEAAYLPHKPTEASASRYRSRQRPGTESAAKSNEEMAKLKAEYESALSAYESCISGDTELKKLDDEYLKQMDQSKTRKLLSSPFWHCCRKWDSSELKRLVVEEQGKSFTSSSSRTPVFLGVNPLPTSLIQLPTGYNKILCFSPSLGSMVFMQKRTSDSPLDYLQAFVCPNFDEPQQAFIQYAYPEVIGPLSANRPVEKIADAFAMQDIEDDVSRMQLNRSGVANVINLEAGATFQAHKSTASIVYTTQFEIRHGYLDLVVASAELVEGTKEVKFNLVTYNSKFTGKIEGVNHSGDMGSYSDKGQGLCTHTVTIDTNKLPANCELLFMAVCWKEKTLKDITQGECQVLFNNLGKDGQLIEALTCQIDERVKKHPRDLSECSNVLICSLRKSGGDINITNHTSISKSESKFDINVHNISEVAKAMFRSYSDRVSLPKDTYRENAIRLWSQVYLKQIKGVMLEIVDFDCTLTSQHLTNYLVKNRSTGAMSNESFVNEFFGGRARLSLIREWFESRCKNGHRIVVVSFGNTSQVDAALRRVGLLQYVSQIYALADKDHSIEVCSIKRTYPVQSKDVPTTYRLYDNATVTVSDHGVRQFDKCSVVRYLHKRYQSNFTSFLDDDKANHCDFADNKAIFMNVVGNISIGLTVTQLKKLANMAKYDQRPRYK
jgi:hypothetical protein